MRNLKRALSLALASVMLLGMMVVGSSAKGIDDFTDKAEIVNQDAVAVTSAIGLFDGYEDGSFGPENVVTRAEMAVIICTMLYGAGVNVNQFAETNVFTDVPAWAQGYVNLCSSLGIVAGVGDGKFDPNATVTTAQAVLMLCRALGYFQNAADFGDNWMLAATAKGTALGLYGDLKLTANAGLTRDNVAELVFNALTKAVPVQYNELLGVYYNENQGIIYSLEFNYLQTLGYKNFDLVYRTDTETIYGRPATTWGTGSYNVKTDAGDTSKTDTLTEDGGLIASMVRMLDKDEIITVPNTPTYTYTTGTDEDDVYKDLGKSVCDETDYDWTVYVNGEKVYADQHRALAYRKLVHCHIFAVDRRQRHLDRTGELLQLLVRTDDGNPVGRHENGLGMRSIDTVTAPQDRNDRHAVAQTQVQLSEAAAYQRTVARHGQPGQMQMLRLRIGRTDDRAEFLLVQIGEEPFLETQELPFDPLPEQNQRQHHQSERNQRAEPGSAQMSHDRHQKHQRDENSQHDERHDQPVIESRIVPQRHEKPFAEVPQRERPQQRSHDEDGRRRRDQFAPETLELALDPRSVVARRDPDDAPQ